MGTALPNQRFDRVYDARDIKQRFAQATGTEWGLYDSWLFRFAQTVLSEADSRGERVFMVLLTTSNHPPHLLDTPRRQYPLDPAALGEGGRAFLLRQTGESSAAALSERLVSVVEMAAAVVERQFPRHMADG